MVCMLAIQGRDHTEDVSVLLIAYLEVSVRLAASDPVVVRESFAVIYKQIQNLILL